MHIAQSNFVDRLDAHHVECLEQHLSDALAQDDSGLHVLVAHDSVLLVVLLHLHRDVVDVVRDLVDCHLLSALVHHIEKFYQHTRQYSLVGMGCNIGLLLGQLVDLLARHARLSDDGAHSDVGIYQINSSVASWVQHLIEIENIIRGSVLLQVVVLNARNSYFLSSLFVLLRLQSSEGCLHSFLSLLLVRSLLSALQLGKSLIMSFIN